MTAFDDDAGWTDDVQFDEPDGPAPTAPSAPGLDALMAALAAIVDELKRVADAVEVLGTLLEDGRGAVGTYDADR